MSFHGPRDQPALLLGVGNVEFFNPFQASQRQRVPDRSVTEKLHHTTFGELRHILHNCRQFFSHNSRRHGRRHNASIVGKRNPRHSALQGMARSRRFHRGGSCDFRSPILKWRRRNLTSPGALTANRWNSCASSCPWLPCARALQADTRAIAAAAASQEARRLPATHLDLMPKVADSRSRSLANCLHPRSDDLQGR